MAADAAGPRRLFAAIELPAPAVEAYVRFQRVAAADWPGARWTAPVNLHITVCFFGDVASASIEPLAAALAEAARRSDPFILKPTDTVLAPPGRRPPTMIWGAWAASPEFSRLAADVRQAAAPFAAQMPEAKEALPHVTLARFREGIQTKTGLPLQAGASDQGPFQAVSLTLFESHLSSGGPNYARLREFPLSADRQRP